MIIAEQDTGRITVFTTAGLFECVRKGVLGGGCKPCKDVVQSAAGEYVVTEP